MQGTGLADTASWWSAPSERDHKPGEPAGARRETPPRPLP